MSNFACKDLLKLIGQSFFLNGGKPIVSSVDIRTFSRKGPDGRSPGPLAHGQEKVHSRIKAYVPMFLGSSQRTQGHNCKGPRSARALRGRTRGEGGGACTCRRFLLTLSPPAPRMHLMSTMARRPRRVARDRLTLTNIQTVGAVARKLK